MLGDIHANYPAFNAVVKQFRPDRFDFIINTGDLTVYSTFPNETIKWFRQRKKSICILGNTDRRILRILKGKKLRRPKKKEKRLMYFWTSEKLLPDNIEYLKSLPKQTDLSLGAIQIGVFHGTFDDADEALFPDAPDGRFIELANDSSYHIHIMGHSHVPYYRIVDGVHFINPGSVGRMFDGDPRASFAILEVSSARINVKHFRIPYPVYEVVSSLKDNHLPDIYSKMFRTGKKLN